MLQMKTRNVRKLDKFMVFRILCGVYLKAEIDREFKAFHSDLRPKKRRTESDAASVERA